MGTALVLGGGIFLMYFMAGAKGTHFVAGVAGGLSLAVMGIFAASYRSQRIAVWQNPWSSTAAQSAGFQTQHALEALGSGGLFGEGLGISHQKGLLPEASSDTIFAVTGEELGLIGSLFVITMFVILAWRGFNVARRAPDSFGRLLAVGITATIVLQAFLNIAVITNIVPFTGVPLPFISEGGSSLVVSLVSIGILLNISREANRPFGRSDGESEPPGGVRRNENRGNRWKDWWPRVPSISRRRVPAPVPVGIQFVKVKGKGRRLPRYG
jgi:cell division protein FtsW